MIIFGTKSITSKNSALQTTCPVCRQESIVVMQSYSMNFHLFWMAVFPYSKNTISICTSCKKQIPEGKYNDDLREIRKIELSSFKYSYKNFLAPIVIVTLITSLMVYSSFTEDDRKKEMQQQEQEKIKVYNNHLANPKVNDVYIVTIKDTSINKKDYRISAALKIDTIVNDSLGFKILKEELVRSRFGAVYNLNVIPKEDMFYNSELVWYSRREIQGSKTILIFKIETIQ